MAIASAGGHWIQLLRVMPAFDEHEVIYVSTKPGFAETVEERFYCMPDANRKKKIQMLRLIRKMFSLVYSIRPSVIVTTGAAPGLIGLMAGKILGCTTIWIDSIANVEELSLSGKIAMKFASRVYTQWPDLAKGKCVYGGNVIS